jgi:Kdo2-lipid IVA lauroyltransferase/acyltransferase
MYQTPGHGEKETKSLSARNRRDTSDRSRSEALPGAKRHWRPFLWLRYLLEALGFFALIGFFRLFGPDRASNIGGFIGRRIGPHSGMARRAVRNLDAAYPSMSAKDKTAILTEMWDNLGRVIAEYAHLDALHSTGPKPRLEIVGEEYARQAYESGKGIIMVSGHFANWEVMPFALRDCGGDGGTMVRSANNPIVNRWLEKARTRNGLSKTIPKGAEAAWAAVGLLRKGKIVCMLIDQRASEGILVPFFGRDAQTTPAPAALALKMGCAVLPAWNERIGPARFRIRVYPPLAVERTGEGKKAIETYTAALTAFIEERVRERPGQWLWIHKRWVDDPLLRKRAQDQVLPAGRGGTSSATSNRV